MSEGSESLEAGGEDRPRRRTRPHYEGDPTLFKVMRSPKWVLALLLALAVAGGFAWLGQWQLGHAISTQHSDQVDAEAVRPLASVTAPGEPVTDASAGMVFETSGQLVAGDFSVVEQRSNGGEQGAWVVGHLATNDAAPGHLAVALGWAVDADAAQRALQRIEADHAGLEIAVEGRYMPGDAPVRPADDQDPSRLLSMSSAQLVNLWQPFEGRGYAGFLVLHPGELFTESQLAEYGLAVIDSMPPLPVDTINWLNLFYALEWVVFGGFALFFWYRLARDDWERIHELRLLAVSEGAAGGDGAGNVASH